MRHTKIVATLGPASSDPEVVERMLQAGVNVVRINFSHGSAEEHTQRAQLIRTLAAKLKYDIGIMADLQGPKIRIGTFTAGRVTLQPGANFCLTIDCVEGDETHVGLDYPALLEEVQAGDTLLLDDGRIELLVHTVSAGKVDCTVVHGGTLSNKKGINKKGGGLSAPALTAKDMDDIKTAVAFSADFIAISFPKDAADLRMARALIQAAGGQALVIAKIERTEAVQNLEELLPDCDGVMVARGDLAVEIGDAAVPAVQKRIIRLAREYNKLSITATQMMESMISSCVPTRAEVSDVANAVLDGTDAVMTSAETASGAYPVETIKAMSRVCIEAEKSAEVTLDRDFLDRRFSRIDQSIAMAALFTAHHFNVKAIVTLTESGSTALWISRLNSGVPVFALTPRDSTRRRLSLYRDVRPFLTQRCTDRDTAIAEAKHSLISAGVVSIGDTLLLTHGEPMSKPGGTNTLSIIVVDAPKPQLSS